jgi:hypothetical protein
MWGTVRAPDFMFATRTGFAPWRYLKGNALYWLVRTGGQQFPRLLVRHEATVVKAGDRFAVPLR